MAQFSELLAMVARRGRGGYVVYQRKRVFVLGFCFVFKEYAERHFCLL